MKRVYYAAACEVPLSHGAQQECHYSGQAGARCTILLTMLAACQLILRCALSLPCSNKHLQVLQSWCVGFGTLVCPRSTHTCKTLGNWYTHSPACPLKVSCVQSPTSSRPPDASLEQHSVDSCPPTRPSTNVTGYAASAVGYL